jgi:predicted N-acetyltransferase YhbS
MHIQVCAESQLTEPLARDIARLLVHAFPQSPKTVDQRTRELLARAYEQRRAGTGTARGQLYFVRDETGVIAHARTFFRTIASPRARITILALASVSVDRRYRGTGMGTAIVRNALAPVDRGECAFSVFQTAAALFYRKLGAVAVENRWVNSFSEHDPYANPWWDESVMRYPGGDGWPAGCIDLRGPAW